VVSKKADGSDQEKPVLTSDAILNPSGWSPDGKTLLLYRDSPQTNSDVVTFDSMNRKLREFVATPATEWHAIFSPDGKWVAYESDESGRFEVYVRSFGGPEGRWQVSTNGGSYPMWKQRDELIYVEGGKVMRVPIQTTPSFSAETAVLLQEAVTAHIDNFNATLMKHFEDMFANGREIIIRVKKFDSWSDDLETEFDGKELSAILEDWMAANAVKGRFNTSDATENMMLFEQVRIPLYDDSGKAIDARGFAKGLQTFLKNPPYSITNKLMMKGLGQAVIVLGEK